MISRIADLLAKGETFCLATIIASDLAETPVGAKAIILRDGTLEGSSGSAAVDGYLRDMAGKALAERKSNTVKIMGQTQAFLDILTADVHLLICGAGHIALPLARFAREVGFKITILDDRADFAHPSRFPGCAVAAQNFTTALHNMSLGPSHYVVVITRGHEHDADCLAEILPKETAYVGLIGSRRRVQFVLEMLGQKGIPYARLQEVFTPIGLPIGSESPEEIALSIVAELVCTRRHGPQQVRALRAAPGENK